MLTKMIEIICNTREFAIFSTVEYKNKGNMCHRGTADVRYVRGYFRSSGSE